ncbi:type VII secretion target [Saccharopolyspora pogona]|uniref:type VII secretion target n=1 Tax=Saccharopolyspora pogona TaxID=333966 RepID=UPI00168A2BB7|nr:type VII secretion target [Saccharopolyspora pogona]
MSDGYSVDAEQLRAHASKVSEIQARFGAVKSASSHITKDDQAYGPLCGWISGLLEERHADQDELIAYVAENLELAAAALRDTADYYESLDKDHADLIRSAGEGMP